MADAKPPVTSGSPVDGATPSEDTGGWFRSLPLARLIWGLGAVAFVGYLAFGTVSARIWRFNRLYFEDRRIVDIWRDQGRNLPDVFTQGAMNWLFYGAVAALVAGTLLGLWYLLDETGFRAPALSASPERHAPDHA